MGPFLSIIIAALMASLALDSGPFSWGEPHRAAATALAIGLIAFAWVTSRRLRSLAPRPAPVPAHLRLADLALYAWLLYGSDWVRVAREATGGLPLLFHGLVLVPFYLASIARVDAAWPPDELVGEGAWTRARAVGFHARMLLIPIAPMVLINAVLDGIQLIRPVQRVLDAYLLAQIGVVVALLAGAIGAMPMILSWLVKAAPLPDGSLRTALDAHLARQGVTVGEIERVDTGGLIANAAYLGLALPWSRIFITDALLRALPEDEVRAVFAHETAHGTRRHLVWFLMLFVALILVVYVAEEALLGPGWLVRIGFIGLFAAGMVAFVAISRRFEVEADLVAAETLGDGDLFNRALARVGTLSGRPVGRHGLRHYSILTRTGIVRGCAENPAYRAFWRSRIRASKILIATIFLVVVAGVAIKAPHDIALGGAAADLFAAEAVLRGQAESGASLSDEEAAEIATRLRSSVDRARGAMANPLIRSRAARIGIAAQMALADEAIRTGDFDEARRISRDVNAHWPRGDLVGDFNRVLLSVELQAIDERKDLASLRDDVATAQVLLRVLTTTHPGVDAELVERELEFLAVATGVPGYQRAFGPDDEEFARHAAWRRIVLERARRAAAAPEESR